jgi:hypothetical protein
MSSLVFKILAVLINVRICINSIDYLQNHRISSKPLPVLKTFANPQNHCLHKTIVSPQKLCISSPPLPLVNTTAL